MYTLSIRGLGAHRERQHLLSPGLIQLPAVSSNYALEEAVDGCSLLILSMLHMVT